VKVVFTGRSSGTECFKSDELLPTLVWYIQYPQMTLGRIYYIFLLL
jgi:hypothetical protein